MIKIGFELEAFVVDSKGKHVLVPAGLPFDECGWLVEIRSEPHTDVKSAIHLLLAKEEAVSEDAKKLGLRLVFEPLAELSRDFKVQAARQHGKGIIAYRNVYGFETHKNSTKFATASLHISFTDQQSFHYGERERFDYMGFVDHAKYIAFLDREFKQEIAQARRNPGFYEVKPDGRIEYRSLPNNISLGKLSNALTQMLSQNHD